MTQRENEATKWTAGEIPDLLAKWDAGEPVWSVEMGGIGPGYEQAIQNTAFEVLRVMQDRSMDHGDWSDKDKWSKAVDEIEEAVMPLVRGEGLSGAQWGAAVNIAAVFYRKGHETALEMVDQDRRILVSKTLPRAALAKAGVS